MERFDTVVIGGGQAGLAVGYHLARRGLDFVILDASERTGDAWRQRWDSLRLFTPARYSGLPGMRFPAAPHYFPTKDEMANYLEAYAKRFNLPVRHGARVDGLYREDGRFVVAAGERRFAADNVVVAMANHQRPRVPSFADGLDPRIVQLHSAEYRNPSQLRPGGVLIVGAGNSGAEIAIELSRHQPTWLSGRHPGHIPFRIESLAARLLLIHIVLGVLFYRVLSIDTPVGRKARPKLLHGASPLVRTKPSDIAAAGVERAPRTVGVQDGRPRLEDGRALDVANVIWATGYQADFSWIDLPVFDEAGDPQHERGVVAVEPGLYFVGLHFLTALSSDQINGVGRDAAGVVRALAARAAAAAPARTAERLPAGNASAA